MKIITIKNYGSPSNPKWSVDSHYGKFGNFISQEAFWYGSRAAAIIIARNLSKDIGAVLYNDLGLTEEDANKQGVPF